MARPAPKIELEPAERTSLEELIRRPSASQAMVRRARIVLLAAAGEPNLRIAEELDVNKNVVTLWRSRFKRERLAGLADRPGRGRKRTYGHDARLKVIVKSCAPPPEAGRWTVRDLAAELATALSISKSTVARILQEIDLKPHQVDGWLNSRDPEFERKAAEICGLYLNPPANALVVCVDEKTGIQALGRKFPDKPMRPGSPRKREFEYQRHGTSSLFAAFLVHSGEVIAQPTDHHTRVEFLAFLKELNRRCPKDKAIHLVVDNLQVHKTPEVKAWLAKHLRFEFHFTPTHASWLNQVEMWFSILARRFLKDGIFASKQEMVERMMRYIEQYNQHAKPFRWTYNADPLRI